MKNIITKDKLDRVIELFAGKSSAIVLGKGPTFKVPKVDCDDLIVCANTTVNFCARCDILVVNDVEVLERLEKEKVEAVNVVLIPVHPHINTRPSPKITFDIFYTQFPNYTNLLTPYNLITTRTKNPDYCNLDTALSTPITGFEFAATYLKQIQFFDFYGVSSLNKSGYHKYFAPEGSILCSYHGERACGIPGCPVESCIASARKTIENHNRVIHLVAKNHHARIRIN